MTDFDQDIRTTTDAGTAMPSHRVLDPAMRLQHAFDVAWRSLNRRDRTELELRRALEGKRVEPELIDQVVADLHEQGYLDDARYATRFAEDQRRLQGWGPDRIERKLRQLGVDRELIATALAADDEEGGDHGRALALLARRFPVPPETTRDRDRALAVLVRRGYSLEAAYDALRTHCAARGADVGPLDV